MVVDDSKSVRSMVARTVLEAQLFEEVIEAKHGIEGLRAAAQHNPDVVLCDLMMPTLDGYGFLVRFRADPANRATPVLVLSGEHQLDARLKGFVLGANDYVSKPFHPLELTARLTNYLKLKLTHDNFERANRDLLMANEELARLASTDALTGLNNRRHFMARAEEELLRATRHNHPLGLVLFDIDHFKSINDRFGHPQGDQVLTVVAQAFRKGLRRTDIVARFGGEEFVAMLPETGSEGAAKVADKIRLFVHALELSALEGRRITLSAGVAVYSGAGYVSLDTLIQSADRALYRAKEGGRDRTVVDGE